MPGGIVIRYECDKCGVRLTANDPQRFILKMEVYAAAGHIDIAADEAIETSLSEVLEQLSNADPDEIEDQTYRCLRFDLCDACRRKLLREPLG